MELVVVGSVKEVRFHAKAQSKQDAKKALRSDSYRNCSFASLREIKRSVVAATNYGRKIFVFSLLHILQKKIFISLLFNQPEIFLAVAAKDQKGRH